MASFIGKLVRGADGAFSLNMEQNSQISDLMVVPLEELLEEFLDKDVLLEINPLVFSTQLKGDN
jgi:succinyl-CoA synthetase beta subunit